MMEFGLFNKFPEEIQRLIFQYAYDRAATTEEAVDLSLVSRNARCWIEPLKYRSVDLVLPDNDDWETYESDCYKKSIFNCPKQLYARHTKYLLVGYNLNEASEIIPFFFTCKNLERLGWWILQMSPEESQEFLESTQHPRLRRLSLFTGALHLQDSHLFSAPIFKNLTHLDIGYLPVDDFDYRAFWNDFRMLEFLIHLHLDFMPYKDYPFEDATSDIGEIVHEMCASCPPRLQYTALLFPFKFLLKALISPSTDNLYENLIQGAVDKRIVVGTDRGKYKFVRDEDDSDLSQTSEEKDTRVKGEEEQDKEDDDDDDDDEDDDDDDNDWFDESEGGIDDDDNNAWDGRDDWDDWIWDWPKRVRKQTNRLTLVTQWMIPSARSGRKRRIYDVRKKPKPDFWREAEETVEPKPDFWREVEETLERRNAELYPGWQPFDK